MSITLLACKMNAIVRQFEQNPSANPGYLRDRRSVLGLGRSPVDGNGNPLQYSCLENPLDRGASHGQSMGSHRLDTTEQLTLYVALALLEMSIKNTYLRANDLLEATSKRGLNLCVK